MIETAFKLFISLLYVDRIYAVMPFVVTPVARILRDIWQQD